jgi:hypothetical protein
MTQRTIRKWALAFLRGESIPLFTLRCDNVAVDRECDRILAKRRARVHKFRSSGVYYASDLSRGGDK